VSRTRGTRELDRVRRERRISRSLTLAELVETYLAQHDVQPVTIEQLRYLLGKATAVFGRRIGELTSQEIAAWRMRLSPGYRFEATQALRLPGYAYSGDDPDGFAHWRRAVPAAAYPAVVRERCTVRAADRSDALPAPGSLRLKHANTIRR
jgi:hypothetical protein